MRSQDGVVIIAVLWVCALIMWFALQIGTETRLQAEEQVHAMHKSQAMHLAIGGGYEALARMGKGPSAGLNQGMKARFGGARKGGAEDDGDDWLPDGRPHVVRYQTGQAIVIVEDENRKVNVNQADPQRLLPIMEKAGLEDEAALTIADAIADFIDRDDLPRLHGAEKDKFKRLGIPYEPFNGPLTSLDQLLLVPGVTQKIFYGYGKRKGGKDDEEGVKTPAQSPFPPKYSLFQMLTVYGSNTRLRERVEEDTLDKIINWQSGGVYRILSCGKARNGPPAVLLWLTVRNAPETDRGYEVLYRKIL